MERSITELAAALDAGEVTSRELVAGYLARIDAYDQRGPMLNAMVVLNPNAADEADRLDAERAAGQGRGPLHGIPLVVKDNYDTGDMPTSAGAIALATSVPPDDSTQVRRLREAGAIVLGKTNMHELARGITTVSSLTGQTRNPYDPTRNPGGSSGGTGAAVAARQPPRPPQPRQGVVGRRDTDRPAGVAPHAPPAEDPAAPRAARRFDPGAAAARGGGDRPRQDQHARAGAGHHHRQLAHR
ncbi:MAG: amidase, partial [Acidobacteria bacterium]|nr:amidase [Acidobacteriota bacterium]